MKKQAARERWRYIQRSDGDVVVPPMEGHRIACCDCGLVHRFTFAVIRDGKKWRVAYAAWRDNRATAQRRRHRDD